MQPSYQTALDQLDAKLDKLVNLLNDLSHQQLNARPEPGAWSVLQVMQHVMLAEKLSVGYVQKKTSNPKALKRSGIANRLRQAILKIFLSLSFKFKAPGIVSEDQFPAEADFDEVVKNWKQVRNDLARLLSGIRPEWKDKELFKHALAGRMTIDGMLLFFESHFDRHLKQIENTVIKVKN